MTNIPAIRRRSDGSIDTAFYLAQGRCRRSEAAHEMAAHAVKKSGRVWVGLAALLVFLPFSGGWG